MGLWHVAQAPPSIWHSNVELDSVDENVRPALVEVVVVGGAVEMVVSGGVVSAGIVAAAYS